MNFIEGHLGGDQGAPMFVADGAKVKLSRARPIIVESSASVTLGVRPEDLQVSPDLSATAGSDALRGQVVLVERLGGTSHIHFDVGAHRLMASVSDATLPQVGDHISARVRGDRVHLFAADGRAIP
jgi:multiple sugar transport system ATP-binding protein